MTTSALRVITEEAVTELTMPPIAFGLIALILFAMFLGVTWTFRNSSQKYANPEGPHAHSGSQEGQQGHV